MLVVVLVAVTLTQIAVLATSIYLHRALAHGSRNYENTARNSAVLALVTGGESLHNNHHAHPGAPKFSVRPRELDPSWLIIRALAAVGALSVARAPVRLPGAETPPRAIVPHGASPPA
ncbi:MAG: hypothetical protein FJZ38_08910 [Candidatus Rokubacteria bacterium]|nr:hypothetical protein [Candidatus Rokubacteria bacterium]